MALDFLFNVFQANLTKQSIIDSNESYTYRALLDNTKKWIKYLTDNKIHQGKIICLLGDFNFETVSLLLALIENNNIIVPLCYDQRGLNNGKISIANAEVLISINEKSEVSIENLPNSDLHELYKKLRYDNHSGLVLFTSGTSGKPKAAVHDFLKLLEKFKVNRKSYKTLNFLLFDHWGGLNTLFHTLSNAGTVFSLKDRTPETICDAIQKHQLELLPTSPTFLNLLILSESYKNYDLSSLKLITYGTEPMSLSTLQKLKSILPNVKFQQTYGLIELGVLRSKSKSDDSLWVKIGGEGYDIRIIDNLLQIKAESAMLGYLNAPNPFTPDGYFITGDRVEVDGEYIKILGRNSEVINVGGEKIYPSEVENIIQSFNFIQNVVVYGERNPITGNIVCAKITLSEKVKDEKQFIKDLKRFCYTKLLPFQVPIKITISNYDLFNERFKKKRLIQ